jgi:outer membrane protein assembly factor BamB
LRIVLRRLGLVATHDTLHAFDAAAGTPSWSWSNGGGSGIHIAPVVAGGVAYVGVLGFGAGLHAVDVADGSPRWHRPSGFPHGIGVGAEHVYLNDGDALVAVRRSDGGQAWRAPAPDEGRTFLDGHPTVAGGRVCVPSRYDGAVHDAASGALLRKRFWTDPLPAVDGQRAYVLSGVSAEHDAVMHTVDAATGSTLWEFGGWDGVTSFPLVAGDHV